MVQEEEQPKLTKEEKREFMNSLKEYSKIGDSIYSSADMKSIVERVKRMIENAELIVNENADWFDKVSMNRHLKDLSQSYKVFEQTAKEVTQLQERLSIAYEDIGQQLSKYFDVE